MFKMAEIGPVTYELYVINAKILPTESCILNTRLEPTIYISVINKCTNTSSAALFHWLSIFIFFCLRITTLCFSSNSLCLLSSISKSFTSFTPPTVSPNQLEYFSLSRINSSMTFLRYFAKYFITTALIGINSNTKIVIR